MSAAKFYLASRKPEPPYRLLWEVSIRWGCRETTACLKQFCSLCGWCYAPNSTLLSVWFWVRFSCTIPYVGTPYILERKLGMLLAIANVPQRKISAFVCCQHLSVLPLGTLVSQLGWACPDGACRMGPGWRKRAPHHPDSPASPLLPHVALYWGYLSYPLLFLF